MGRRHHPVNERDGLTAWPVVKELLADLKLALEGFTVSHMAKQPSPYLISRVLFQLVDLTHAQSCTRVRKMRISTSYVQNSCQVRMNSYIWQVYLKGYRRSSPNLTRSGRSVMFVIILYYSCMVTASWVDRY